MNPIPLLLASLNTAEAYAPPSSLTPPVVPIAPPVSTPPAAVPTLNLLPSGGGAPRGPLTWAPLLVPASEAAAGGATVSIATLFLPVFALASAVGAAIYLIKRDGASAVGDFMRPAFTDSPLFISAPGGETYSQLKERLAKESAQQAKIAEVQNQIQLAKLRGASLVELGLLQNELNQAVAGQDFTTHLDGRFDALNTSSTAYQMLAHTLAQGDFEEFKNDEKLIAMLQHPPREYDLDRDHMDYSAPETFVRQTMWKSMRREENHLEGIRTVLYMLENGNAYIASVVAEELTGYRSHDYNTPEIRDFATKELERIIAAGGPNAGAARELLEKLRAQWKSADSE